MKLKWQKFDPAKHPRLARALVDGLVWSDGAEYVGRAGDGVVVGLGTIEFADGIENFLANNPDPTKW